VIADTVLLAWVSFVGTLFWPLNPDAALLVYIGARHQPLVPGVLASLVGQLAMLSLLVVVGHVLRRNWTWLDRKCGVVERRWGVRLVTRTPWVAASSGFLGIPPGAATVLLASALRVPARRILPLLFVCRLLWLIVLARLGHFFGTP
jgi:membrane protein YqaA with SNARE-associated domain